MTEGTAASAERIRRLQERRAATSAGSTTKRRRHPAAASRIVLAGLSVASFFGVVGAMAVTHSTTSTAVQPASSNRRSSTATPATQPGAGAAHTRTRAS